METTVNIRNSVISKIFRSIVVLAFIALVTLNLLPDYLAGIPAQVTQLTKSDVVIVLGTPSDSEGNPSPVMRERVLQGVELLKKNYAKYIIFTGAAAHNEFVEAEVMANLAKANGIKPEQIVCEPNAQNTAQNAFNSVELMREHGWKSAIVVTSAAHLRRASHIFSHYPIKYCLASCNEPAGQPFYKSIVFDQREKIFMLGDLFTRQSSTFGLTPAQAAKFQTMEVSSFRSEQD
ncbi:MAG: YdcF family protein [Candidatus Melainabacteria bacterium]|nr:MAG: YdcF family protein [Candidatus Melainabacteria bacterium]